MLSGATHIHTSATPCESRTWLAVRRAGKIRVRREDINFCSREWSDALSWFKGSTLDRQDAGKDSKDEEQHIRNSHRPGSEEWSTETAFLVQCPGDASLYT